MEQDNIYQGTSEVAESEARFRNLMEQSPLAIAIMTPEGQITEVNTAWMRQWALEEEERTDRAATTDARVDGLNNFVTVHFSESKDDEKREFSYRFFDYVQRF